MFKSIALLVAFFIYTPVDSRGLARDERTIYQKLFFETERTYPRDENGEEFLLCKTMGMDEDHEVSEGVTKCKVGDEQSMGVKSLGLACMGVFDEDFTPIRQGCWIHQMDDVINKTCPHNTCIAESEFGPYFCCCTTPMCNRGTVRLIDIMRDLHMEK